ncbi:hypothetical protein R75465_07341 [Paraburkholderia aspalathi]|nr:hypothetical protein R75465_07341 [Paraburkholderia aspalathi]
MPDRQQTRRTSEQVPRAALRRAREQRGQQPQHGGIRRHNARNREACYLLERRERHPREDRVAKQAGGKRDRQGRAHGTRATARIPIALRAEIDHEILNRIIDRFADQARAEHQRQQMQLTEHQHRHRESTDNAERRRNETEQQQTRRAEHPHHQQRNPAQRRDADQMHLMFRCATCRLRVEHRTGSRHRHVRERLLQAAFTLRKRGEHGVLRFRFVSGARQRGDDQHAGRAAAMRHQHVVFEFEIRRGERQTAEPVFEPTERIVGERRGQATVQWAVDALCKCVVQRGACSIALRECRAVSGRQQTEPIRHIQRGDLRQIERRQLRRHRAERPALLQRCAELFRSRFGVRVIVAGDQKNRAVAQRTRQRIDRLFSDRIRFRGRQQRQQIGLQRRRSRETPAAIQRRGEREQQPRGAHAPRLFRGPLLQHLHYGAPRRLRSADVGSLTAALFAKSSFVMSPFASVMRKLCR